MSKKHKTSERVLGIAATSRAVHAVLLEQGPDGPQVARRFSRQRAATGYEEPSGHPAEQMKDQPVGGGEDFTLEFGDGTSSNTNLFLGAEFGVSEEEGEPGAAAPAAPSFEFELGRILAEVSDAGYGDAVLAFALNAAEAPFVDIHLPGGEHGQDTLLEVLATQYSGAFDADRTVFLPMSRTDESDSRYLALFPKPTDSVTSTLVDLRQNTDLEPLAALVDSELSVLLGLARSVKDVFGFRGRGTAKAEERVQLFDDEGDEQGSNAAEKANTVVVRAGAEDTLVLFLSGDTVHHAEILRSLTAFDQAETVCSRVLLQQDEHGRGEVDHVLLLSEEHETELADTFGVFFPDAEVDLLRDYLPEMDVDETDSATALVSACGAALRVLEGSAYAGSFESVNFLPRKLSRRKFRLPVSVHMVAMSLLIVMTTLFFMTRYSTAETEIEAYRNRLGEVAPNEVNEDISVLQARIDSMEHLYATYTRAIEVLDTLLIGSDRWSRMLEHTSKEASTVSGFWIESFVPSGVSIQLSGNATSRDQVVVFASRVDGTIESLTFSEIREWPVYSYTMSIPVADSLPYAARYLRDHVKLDDEALVDDATSQSNDQNGTE